jgi:hypothetical protein
MMIRSMAPAQISGRTILSFRCSAVAQLVWDAATGNTAYEFEFARVPAGREALRATDASELSYLFGLAAVQGMPSFRLACYMPGYQGALVA